MKFLIRIAMSNSRIGVQGMSEENQYVPPAVWKWNQDAVNKFSNINRPVSGAIEEKTLPVGVHPLQLYSLGTPNGVKVTIMLEELLALGKTRSRVRCAPDQYWRWLTVWQWFRSD